jgi:hypothetical protein
LFLTLSLSCPSVSLLVLCAQYKDKSVVLERERFEALTALDMKEQELIHLKRDLEYAIEGKRFLEEEVTGLRYVSLSTLSVCR